MTLREKGFIHISDAYDKALEYAIKRRSGEVKSIKTPWDSFNRATMDGIEWNTLTVIAGRPASGKTLISSLITREAFKLNPDQDFCVLDFQFEMLSRTIAMREISGSINVPTRRMNSVGIKMTDEDLESAKKYCDANKDREIYTYEHALSVDGLEKKIYDFVEFKKKPTLITIDHSLLINKSASEKDRIDTLHNLSSMLSKTRKKLPVSIILLSQLNREIETVERMKPGSQGNYVKTSDVFGADSLLQNADTLVGINRPATLGIRLYGPRKRVMEPDTIAVHFLKERSGSTNMTFFKADFPKMKMYEIEVESEA